MTHIALEFVVSTLLAIALVAVLSIGAVYLTDNTSSPPIRRKPITPSPAAAELLGCQTLTGDFCAFTCCFPIRSEPRRQAHPLRTPPSSTPIARDRATEGRGAVS